MRLKRVVLHGFKSFADRTEFALEGDGMSCIVGPNGCGKSNVIDAVKWILGEQRPTSLRGREMSDVIFNGTVRRPPMGLCEGVLVFDNSSGTLPVEEPEVEITRRVLRTGETDYLINRRPVRLKDVRDLFAGTGLGPGGYGFMEQGKIDSILASNPVDRRRVFEEAAGISRFRARKHECTLKLRRVEDNLTRLADITEEIVRQIRSLKIHAGKARRHREISERIRALQLALNLHRYRKLVGDQDDVRGELDALVAERDRLGALSESRREEIRKVEGELETALEAVSRVRTRHAELSSRIESCREKIEFHEGYRGELAEGLERLQGELAELSGRQGELEEGSLLAGREQRDLVSDRDRATGDRERHEEAYRALRDQAQELERERMRAQGLLVEAENRVQEARRDEARLEAEIGHLAARLEATERRRRALDAEREQIRARLEERSGHQDSHTSVLERRRGDLADAERGVEELDQEFLRRSEELRELEGEHQHHAARYDVLHGLLSRGEGLDEGVRALFEARDSLPGFRGLLHDLFEVELSEARAVEAALGEAASAVVVETAEDALFGMRLLEERGLGGALFLPLDCFAGLPLRPLNGIRPATPEIAGVLGALVGGLEIVTREQLAGALTDRPGELSPVLVSQEGVVLREGRVLRVPRRRKGAEGVVVLHAEMKEIQRALPGLEAGCTAARKAVEEARAARDAGRSRVRELSVALLSEEGEAARLDQEIVRLVRDAERLGEEGERLFEEGRSAEESGREARERAAELELLGERLAEERRAREDAVRRHAAALEEHAVQVERAGSELEAGRIAEAQIVERLETLRHRQEHLAEGLEGCLRRRQKVDEEIERLETSERESRRIVEEQRTRLGELGDQASEGARELAECEARADEVRQRQRHASTELEAAETSLAQANERIGSQRGREGELRAALESLLERSQDEMGVDLVEYAATAPAEEMIELPELGSVDAEEAEEAGGVEGETATEGPVEIGTADAGGDAEVREGAEVPGAPEAEEPVASAASPAADSAPRSVDWKAVEAELKQLRERLVRLGNVNLAAVEELGDAEERAAFIFKERDDLDRSREELRRILKSIEEQSSAMFLETFNSVGEHFAVIFRQLFGGGKADISLEDPDAPLESGIEIKARPPGKQLRSISLLSGGERTMTAVALLFAIFRAHPAPCAFLDEVDAALDEDNIERFCLMLDAFVGKSQFVIVTHSKRTMERADTLYGVTMPERGVSRPVTVRLEQVGDDGSIEEVQPQARPASPPRSAAAGRGPSGNGRSGNGVSGNGRSGNGTSATATSGNGRGRSEAELPESPAREAIAAPAEVEAAEATEGA